MKRTLFCIIVWALFSTTVLGQNVDELLQHKSSTRRAAAVKMLVENERGPQLIEKLKPLANDTSISVRVAVAKELGRTKLPEASVVLEEMRAASTSKVLTDTIDEALKLTGPVPPEVKERLANSEKSKAEIDKKNKELAVKFEEWVAVNMPVSDKRSWQYVPGRQVGFQSALRQVPMIQQFYEEWLKTHDKKMVQEFLGLSNSAIVRKELDAIVNESGLGEMQRVLKNGQVVTVSFMWMELKKIAL